MQQHLLQTTGYAHAFVLCQVLEQSCQALLQTHRHVHTLDLDLRPGVEEVVPERKMISIQVAHAVISDSIFPVGNLRRDFNAIGAMEFVELVCVADKKGHGASL